MKNSSKINVNTFIGIAAILISLGTLIVLIYQSQLMREHEERSAIPKLELCHDITEGNYALRLVNKGLGPALIEDVKVESEGKTYEIDPMFFAINYADTAQTAVKQISGTHLIKGIIVSPEMSIRLVESANPQQDSLLRGLFYEDPVKVVIHYSSIYGKLWKLDGVGALPGIETSKEAKFFKKLFDE